MKRILALMALVTVCASTTGCFHEQIIMNPKYDANVTTPDSSEMQISLLGLVNLSGEVNLQTICPNGVDRVASNQIISLYAISFSKAEVFCSK